MQKPERINDKIWRQHLQWLRIMKEGQLTNDPVIKSRRSSSAIKMTSA